MNKDFANIVPKVLHWLRVDFTPLRDPRLGYEQQDHIDPYCVEMGDCRNSFFVFVSDCSRSGIAENIRQIQIS